MSKFIKLRTDLTFIHPHVEPEAILYLKDIKKIEPAVRGNVALPMVISSSVSNFVCRTKITLNELEDNESLKNAGFYYKRIYVEETIDDLELLFKSIDEDIANYIDN